MITAAEKYREPRAHALRARYLERFGGEEIPVPVEAIAEDLLGLRVEQSWDIGYSGMLRRDEPRVDLQRTSSRLYGLAP